MFLQDMMTVASLGQSFNLDGALIASLTSLITILIAIGGLALSLHTFTDTRRREVQQSALQQFQETSTNLSSGSPALRSVGVEHMARYLSQPDFSKTALRVLVYDYLLEPDLHLRSRIRDVLVSHARSHPELLDALAHMNRETWRLIISASKSATPPDADNRLDQLVATLELTKEAISAVLRTWPVEIAEGRPSTPRVDLSGTRLDGTDLSGANLVDAELRWTSLSFCNLYRARLTNCDMSFAVLVGAHMEKAQINLSHVDHAVFLRAGFKNTGLRFPEKKDDISEKDDIPVYFSSSDGISFSDERTRRVIHDHLLDFEDEGFSICMEQELTWPGLWVPSREGHLTAIWESEVDRDVVDAKMYLDSESRIRRRDSSDGNDGEYRIDHRVPLDPLQRFDLVIGSRGLRSGRNEVRRAWHGIWWTFDKRSPATGRTASSRVRGLCKEALRYLMIRFDKSRTGGSGSN